MRDPLVTLKDYIRSQLRVYDVDPPRTQFQQGHKTALEEILTEIVLNLRAQSLPTS
jgi:hypothetical protein